MMLLARQTLLSARKNLSMERRDGDALLITAPFGAAALLLIPIAVGTDIPLLRAVGPGMYWAVVLLFGLLVTLRESGLESAAQLSMLRLAGVPTAARLLGGSLASAVRHLSVLRCSGISSSSSAGVPALRAQRRGYGLRPCPESLVSREGAFLINNVLLTLFAFVVLVGPLSGLRRGVHWQSDLGRAAVLLPDGDAVGVRPAHGDGTGPVHAVPPVKWSRHVDAPAGATDGRQRRGSPRRGGRPQVDCRRHGLLPRRRHRDRNGPLTSDVRALPASSFGPRHGPDQLRLHRVGDLRCQRSRRPKYAQGKALAGTG